MMGMYDNLAMFESPIQILIVLTIALLVFGPKKLPEIGRQIGGALRELRKAAGEVSRSFSTDYEPESTSYSYSGNSASYDRTASYYTPPPALDAPMDLSDYTIVGVTHVENTPEPETNFTGDLNQDMRDYTLTGDLLTRAAVREANVSEPTVPDDGPAGGSGEIAVGQRS